MELVWPSKARGAEESEVLSVNEETVEAKKLEEVEETAETETFEELADLDEDE